MNLPFARYVSLSNLCELGIVVISNLTAKETEGYCCKISHVHTQTHTMLNDRGQQSMILTIAFLYTLSRPQDLCFFPKGISKPMLVLKSDDSLEVRKSIWWLNFAHRPILVYLFAARDLREPLERYGKKLE